MSEPWEDYADTTTETTGEDGPWKDFEPAPSPAAAQLFPSTATIKAPPAPLLPAMGERSTTFGGPPKPLADYAETMSSVQSDVADLPFSRLVAPRVSLTEPRIELPKVPIKPDAGFWTAAGSEVVNALEGLPEFFTSDAGILSLMAGKLAPRLVAAGFAADLTTGAFKQAKQAYQNWGQMTPAEKGKATVDVLASLAMGGLTGAHAAGLRLPAKKTVTETTPPVPPSEIPKTPSETGLLPAVRKVGGEVAVGEAGQTHPEIMKEREIPREDVDQRVFVKQATGEVLDREQAAAETPQIPTATEPERRHSTDLPEAKPETLPAPAAPAAEPAAELKKEVAYHSVPLWFHHARENTQAVLDTGRLEGGPAQISRDKPFVKPPKPGELDLIFTSNKSTGPGQPVEWSEDLVSGLAPTSLYDSGIDILVRDSSGNTVSVKDAYLKGEKNAETLKDIGRSRLSVVPTPSPPPTAPKKPLRKAKASDWTTRDLIVGEDFAGPPNSIVIQLRGLDTVPLGTGKPIVFPFSGDLKAAGKTIFERVFPIIRDRDASWRESIFKITDANGRATHSLRVNPTERTVSATTQTELEAAREEYRKQLAKREPIDVQATVQEPKQLPAPPTAPKAVTEAGTKPGVSETPMITQRPKKSPEVVAAEDATQAAFEKLGAAEKGAYDKSKRKGMTKAMLAKLSAFDKLVEAEKQAKAQAKAKPTPAAPPPSAAKAVAEPTGIKTSATFERFDNPSGEFQKQPPRMVVVSRSTIPGDKPWRLTVFGGPKDMPVAIGHVQLDNPNIIPKDALVELHDQLGQYVRNLSIEGYAREGDQMVRQPPPSAGPAPETGAGPGTPSITQTSDVPGAQIEQLSQAFRQINAQQPSLFQRVKAAFDLGRKKELSQNLVARTLSALKTSGDYLIDTWRGQMDLDPVLKAKGQLSAELETRGWRMRVAMRDMKRAVPDKAVREAISKWVDAGGDVNKLRQSAETVPASRRAPYIRAMQLSPDEKIVAGHIQSYFEARLKEAQDAGVVSEGIEDYIHRIYPRDTKWRRGIINAVQNAVLDTRKPGLAKQRFYELDADAERNGQLPTGDFIPRVLDYEASLSKVIASRAAVKRFTEIKMPDGRPMLDVSGIGVPIENAEGIREATLIKPSFKPGDKQLDDAGKPTKNYRMDYQSRDYPALKRWRWATNDAQGNPIFVQGDVLVHPDAVHRIDALLEPSKVQRYPIARAALSFGSVFKQTMLDFSGFHQVQISIHALEHKVNPFNLVKDVDTNHPDVQGLLRGGMTLGGTHVGSISEEGLVGRSLSRQIPGIGELMQSYHDWLFQNFIPRVKTTMALKALERNRARFAKDLASGRMTEDALYHQTAKEANAAFGEQNYIMLERSKTAQDMARLILLAPDFLEARGRFALQAFTKLGGEQRMALLLGAVTLYTVARLMNKALDNRWHNEPDNLFSVVYNGKSYSLRTVQGDILHAVEEPVRFWLHRLNPAIARPLFELMTQRDEFGRKRTFWQVMGDTISNAVPISMRAGREQSIWTSLLNAFGGSVRRENEVMRVYQEAAKWKESNHVRTEPGEFIYDPGKDIFRPIKLALMDGNPEAAAIEYRKLIASKEVTPAQAQRHFQQYARSPFTGSAANDSKFRASLSEEQKRAYDGAKQEKQRIYREFLKAASLSGVGGSPYIFTRPQR